MIFKRAIVAELSNTAGGVFTVLFSIVFSIGLVRILGEAAGGRIDNQAVFSICLLYTSPSPRDGLLSRMPSSA